MRQRPPPFQAGKQHQLAGSGQNSFNMATTIIRHAQGLEEGYRELQFSASGEKEKENRKSNAFGSSVIRSQICSQVKLALN